MGSMGLIVHGILVSNWKQNMLYIKSSKSLRRKSTSTFAGSKVSSSSRKYVFYRPELKATAGPHGMEF